MNSEIQKLNNEVKAGGLKLLKPAVNQMAFLKMGLFGDTGSGKTYTASRVIGGLHKYCKSKRPVAMFDTEGGSDFLVPYFKDQKIEFVVQKSSSLADLADVMAEAEQECFALIIDSISNVWNEFTKSYLEKSKSKFIELWDWKPIKDKWNEIFAEPFKFSKLHIAMCGREAGIYQEVEVEKGGQTKSQTVRVGDKMQAESQTGYEPSLLCQMAKVYVKDGGIYVRRCNVIKERFDVIDSQQFDNPQFEDFLPHIKLLNLGGEHGVAEVHSNSQVYFDEPNNTWDQRKRKVEIILEKIKAKLIETDMDGTSVPAKKARVGFMQEFFGTTAWAEIEAMKLEKLEECFNRVSATDLNEWRIGFLKTVKDENQGKEKAVSNG